MQLEFGTVHLPKTLDIINKQFFAVVNWKFEIYNTRPFKSLEMPLYKTEATICRTQINVQNQMLDVIGKQKREHDKVSTTSIIQL